MSDDYQSNTVKLHGQSPPFLPDELIIPILLYLPVRSLLQFKCVCKSWKTLISDPQFANTHLQNLTSNPTITDLRLLCYMMNQSYKISSYPMKPLFENPSEPTEPVEFAMEHRFHILGSSNGLLCLLGIDHGYVKLWNPSIGFKSRKSRTLDSFSKDILIRYYGFGYDHVNDKYKVLLSLRRVAPFYEYVTQIYTFGGNSWRTIQDFPYSSTNRALGKFVSGTLNWVKPGYGFIDRVIISFDLEKEIYKEVLLPDNDGVETYNHVLGVSGNCLCVCFDSNQTHLDFWLMKNYGVAESWTRLVMIPQSQFPVPGMLHLYYNHLFILGNSVVLITDCGLSFSFNLNIEKLDLQLICSDLGWGRHIYHESLIVPQC